MQPLHRSPKPPPLGTPCGDCRGEDEYLSALRLAADGERTLPVCGRCALARVMGGEVLRSFDLFETPQELLDRAGDRLRAVVRDALLRGYDVEDLVGVVTTRNGSGGHYANPKVGVGPRSAIARALDDRAGDVGPSSLPGVSRRARRAAARECRRTIMQTMGGSRLGRAAPAGSVHAVVTTTEDAAVLLFSLEPSAPPAPADPPERFPTSATSPP